MSETLELGDETMKVTYREHDALLHQQDRTRHDSGPRMG